MKYKYTSRPMRMVFRCLATAQEDGTSIIVEKHIDATCERHAAEQFEEILEQNEFGQHDYEILISDMKTVQAMYDTSLHCRGERTKDRQQRGVEGTSNA